MERECLICSCKYESNQPKSLFCSKTCSNKHNSSRKRRIIEQSENNDEYKLTQQDILAEEWHTLNKYSGKYEVSNMGRIRNTFNSKIVPSFKNKVDGYYYVSLLHKGERGTEKVHRLCALNFVPNPENKTFVDHKFNNKSDNRASQLRWVTFQENINSAWDDGIYHKGQKCSGAILTEDDVREIKILFSKGVSGYKIKNKFKCSVWAIYNIKQNKTWKHVQI